MANVVNITLKESDYNLIMGHFSLLDIVPISTKILPDDSILAEDENYKHLQKKYKIARKELEDYRFNHTTNK
jgi:hypothetical protein